jgi:hypothetical protein
VFEWRRSPLTGSRFEIRWLSGRGKTLTFFVIPVFSVAFIEKSCDVCGNGWIQLPIEFFGDRGCLCLSGIVCR